MIKLLFVCLGNICRSPAAQAIMEKLVNEAGLSHKISCDSAGTSAGHAGQQADERMRMMAEKRGYHIDHLARQVTDFDLVEFDYIITMDQNNYLDVRAMAHDKEQQQKVSLLCSYGKTDGIAEVPDPYWGGENGFNTVLDIIENGCKGLLAKIYQTVNNEK